MVKIYSLHLISINSYTTEKKRRKEKVDSIFSQAQKRFDIFFMMAKIIFKLTHKHTKSIESIFDMSIIMTMMRSNIRYMPTLISIKCKNASILIYIFPMFLHILSKTGIVTLQLQFFIKNQKCQARYHEASSSVVGIWMCRRMIIMIMMRKVRKMLLTKVYNIAIFYNVFVHVKAASGSNNFLKY